MSRRDGFSLMHVNAWLVLCLSHIWRPAVFFFPCHAPTTLTSQTLNLDFGVYVGASLSVVSGTALTGSSLSEVAIYLGGTASNPDVQVIFGEGFALPSLVATSDVVVLPLRCTPTHQAYDQARRRWTPLDISGNWLVLATRLVRGLRCRTTCACRHTSHN